MRVPRLLAIHDLCVFGRCSLSAAVSVLSARGVQCCPLPSALFPAPTNYPGVTMTDLSEYAAGNLEQLKTLDTRFDAIYSGYLANTAQAALVGRAHDAYPDALRVVDPAMGDNGRLYRTIDKPLTEAMKTLADGANLITPNVTEAALLLGKPAGSAPADEGELEQWLRALSGGGRSVVLTGASFREGEIAVGWAERGAAGLFRHPRTGAGYPGAGDLFASYLLAEVLHGAALGAAAEAAARFTGECAAETVRRGTDPREGLLFEAVLKKTSVYSRD
ncbi:MAG: bifunctional hydroxymethylpyrimidine kinase/phosphomethylpyrimidine kinase [Oscillospiraceae bacterium]|nr:bifunctional hydroxymethylpyrimidine kinase/phosphomethylpyrimidine kinase [Oscillospiraceae bacterium]